MENTKICKPCNIAEPIGDYYKNKHSGYYHSNSLKCVNEQRKQQNNKRYVTTNICPQTDGVSHVPYRR